MLQCRRRLSSTRRTAGCERAHRVCGRPVRERFLAALCCFTTRSLRFPSPRGCSTTDGEEWVASHLNELRTEFALSGAARIRRAPDASCQGVGCGTCSSTTDRSPRSGRPSQPTPRPRAWGPRTLVIIAPLIWGNGCRAMEPARFPPGFFDDVGVLGIRARICRSSARPLLSLAIIVGVIYLLFRQDGPLRGQSPEGSARDILDRRYARGELTKEQYEQMKRDLGQMP